LNFAALRELFRAEADNYASDFSSSKSSIKIKALKYGA
jgi:hypothetical protein